MQITVNVEDETFKQIVEQEIGNIPSEKLQEIIIDALKGYFSVNDYKNAGFLVYREANDYYGSRREYPTEFTNKIINNCDYSKLQDIVDAAIEDLKTKHEHLLKEILCDTIIKGLVDNYSFKQSLSEIVSNELMRRNN